MWIKIIIIFYLVEIGLYAKIMGGHSGQHRLPDVSWTPTNIVNGKRSLIKSQQIQPLNSRSIAFDSNSPIIWCSITNNLRVPMVLTRNITGIIAVQENTTTIARIVIIGKGTTTTMEAVIGKGEIDNIRWIYLNWFCLGN